MNQLLQQLDRPPLTDDPTWQKFRNDLKAFIEVTEDLRRYSLEGFDKFKVVDKELNALLDRSAEEQSRFFARAKSSNRSRAIDPDLEHHRANSGRPGRSRHDLGSAAAFGEMRRSVEEARRERVFTSQLLEGMVSAVAASMSTIASAVRMPPSSESFPAPASAHQFTKSLLPNRP